ncbi:malonyl CoA-acyl carrier protein transacylase [Bacteroidia bacterium]|nr:malonyl CoA-acyl carrier protein transacylase [Bacteroidia bacterium]
MKSYVFPGQGAQFVGMGKDLFDSHAIAKEHFKLADTLLGYSITDLMFSGTEDDLRRTDVTQPAVFLHSVIAALCTEQFRPSAVAGHSLGEFSALVAAESLSFTDGLQLVYRRAQAMQQACELVPSTMAAILGLSDEQVETICKTLTAETGEVVVPANYNCPGQLVISGSVKGIEIAIERLKEAGAKRALPLKVGGAFHSPLMQPAADDLAKAIQSTHFKIPTCPIFQNVDAKPHTNPDEIKANLIAQLTAPVRWTQIIKAMLSQGIDEFVELGPGNVLTGLVTKIKA